MVGCRVRVFLLGRLGFAVAISCFVFANVVACGSSHEVKIVLVSDSSLVDEIPSLLRFKKPVYPSLARLAMVEEVVWVEMIVDANGLPHDVVAVRDTRNMTEFRESAEVAATKCIFSSATKNGKSVSSRVQVAFEFKVSAEERRRDAIRRRMGG